MLEIILGIASSVITEAAKKIGMDANKVILGLALVCGTAYYVINHFSPGLIEATRQNVLAIYGISQMVYNTAIKLYNAYKAGKEPLITSVLVVPLDEGVTTISGEEKRLTPRVLRPKVDWSKKVETNQTSNENLSSNT